MPSKRPTGPQVEPRAVDSIYGTHTAERIYGTTSIRPRVGAVYFRIGGVYQRQLDHTSCRRAGGCPRCIELARRVAGRRTFVLSITPRLEPVLEPATE